MINQAVILAAGESSRFWPLNSTHKSLLKIMGKPIILHTLEAVVRNGIKDIIIVQDGRKYIENELKNYPIPGVKIRYVEQKEPRGMGDALLQTKDLLIGQFLVILPERVDCEEMIVKIKAKIDSSKAKTVLVGCKTDNPSLFGIMEFRGDRVIGIVEKPKKGKEPSDTKVVGVYVLEPSFFDFHNETARHQYDFEDSLSSYMKKNDVEMVLMDKEGMSLKYPWHLFDMQKYLFDKYLESKIDSTAVITKNVIIEGKVYIGKNTKIFENSVIKGPCYIGENVVIGNNSVVRDYVDIEKGSSAGALVEIARSIFQEGVHVHSGYFGDSILGKNCKIGTASVTANIRIDRGEIFSVVKGEKKGTGRMSLGCFTGEDSRIGVNSSLMPGVFIGKNSLVGPNSLVSENVADGILHYTKFERVVKKRS